MERTIQGRGGCSRPRKGMVSAGRCGFQAALFGAMTALCLGADPVAPQDEKTADTAPVVLTRAMIDSREVEGLEVIAGDRTRDTLRVAVSYERNDRDHLGRASLEFQGEDKVSLSLPVRIVTDKDGRDRLVFSVSASMAEFCRLRLDLLPRDSVQAPPRAYLLILTEWIDSPRANP